MSQAQPPAAASLLSVQDLQIRAGQNTLVESFNLQMARGERIGLIGESGSGKSMTASALMQLLPEGISSSGSIRFAAASHDLVGASEKQMSAIRGQSISMVFQEPLSALNPLMRIGAQVAEVLAVHKSVPTRQQRARRVLELLAQVRLPDPAEAAKAYPHQLSGGQRQRVMLAIALANDPALLLCDEPTTALDVTVQRQVLDLVLESVRASGTGLLFITHDLAVVANICDRLLVMNHGKIVEEGFTEEVLLRPQHSYTRGLLAASDLSATDRDGKLFTVATAGDYQPLSLVEPNKITSTVQPSVEPTDPPIISVRDLTRNYQRSGRLFSRAKSIPALRGISFDVQPGEHLGIVGESGSGKSTLLRILAGLDQPSSGSVSVAGNNPHASSLDLQLIFQDPLGSLDPRMTVQDIISEPLRGAGTKLISRKIQRAKVATMLDAVGLARESAERYPHEFSGGQRQRISMARALICRPAVLVADEPVSALDVSVRAQVLNLLAELVQEYQLTLVLVSHDLGVVRHLCEKIAVLSAGRIVEAGLAADIYERPQHEYTKTLLNSSLQLHSELQSRMTR